MIHPHCSYMAIKTVVPIWHSEKIDAAFGEVKVPHKLIVIEGWGHGFDEAGNKKMFAGMLAWFDEHLATKK